MIKVDKNCNFYTKDISDGFTSFQGAETRYTNIASLYPYIFIKDGYTIVQENNAHHYECLYQDFLKKITKELKQKKIDAENERIKNLNEIKKALKSGKCV